MTSIGGHQQAVLQAARLLSLRLATGQPVQARVLGPTRHGVSVLIGHETFQLHAPSKLTNAETLTLQRSAPPSVSGQPVKVIASDDQPLRKPVEAHLTAGMRTSQPDASTIVQKNEIKVVANPVSPEGRVLGPGVTLHLQTSTLETAVKATGEPSIILSGDEPVAEPNSLHRTAADLVRPGGSSTPPTYRPETNVVYDRGSGAGAVKSEPTDKLPAKVIPMQTSPLASSGSANPLPAVIKSSVDHVRLHSDLRGQQERTVASTLPNDGGSIPVKNTTTSAAVNQGQGAVTDAKVSAQTPHSAAVLHKVAGIGEVVTASVVGRTNTGNVLLETEGQLMRIETPLDLPPGATLQVTFASGLSAWINPTNRRSSENPATLLNKLIGLLDDIDRAGRQVTEPDHPLPTRQLPTADRHLASRFLGLLPSEAGGQPLSSVLSSSPERGGMATLQGDQIQAMVRELGSMASESLADGWKSLTLPLGSDQNQAVSLYFREHELDPDDEPSDGDDEHKKTQRAVFDVSFSKLGRCQIDALCQEQRFDLLIRSEKRLGPEDRQDLSALFVSACEIAGMKGEIGFTVGSFFEPVRSSVRTRELRT